VEIPIVILVTPGRYDSRGRASHEMRVRGGSGGDAQTKKRSELVTSLLVAEDADATVEGRPPSVTSRTTQFIMEPTTIDTP
jgi:hypothetical protein